MQETKKINDFDATEVEEKSEEKNQLGKFKDVNALLDAYNSLQSEFTKRCQKIKELEAIAEELKSAKEDSLSEEKREEIIKEYLKEILSLSQKSVVMDGTGVTVKTPSNRPKTILEAGELTKSFMAKE
ncbi:MAG: hypothetical protein E7342_00195 [Clostridiales bacterium]|nr:hypothetical protein [Clostridiales bacterium]